MWLLFLGKTFKSQEKNLDGLIFISETAETNFRQGYKGTLFPAEDGVFLYLCDSDFKDK